MIIKLLDWFYIDVLTSVLALLYYRELVANFKICH